METNQSHEPWNKGKLVGYEPPVDNMPMGGRCSAEAVDQEPIRLRPQWFGYQTLIGEAG